MVRRKKKMSTFPITSCMYENVKWVCSELFLWFGSQWLCSALQVFKDVEMEPLGRKSGDSFKSMSSSSQSSRGMSRKTRLERRTAKTRTAEKVRKKKRVFYFHVCLKGRWITLLFICLHVFMHLWVFLFVSLFLFLLNVFFTLPASICHEWIPMRLWEWTGLQLSHHRHSPLASSYQEAQPESDHWDFRCAGEDRQHQ